MKVFKKSVSLLLTMVMLLSIFTMIPVSVSAKVEDIAESGAQTDLATTGGLSLAAIKSKFPKDAYWNHKAQSGHGYHGSYIHDGSCNNPNGYSWTPCYTHTGNAPIGQYDCNEFGGAIQCAGFAKK